MRDQSTIEAIIGGDSTKRSIFNRDFILMWQGAFLSHFGDIVYGFAISFWVLQTTGSTALMGTSAALSSLPRVIIAPFAGALADRLNRKNILAQSNLIRGILMLVMAYLTFSNLLTVPFVMFTTFVISAAGVFATPCVVSIIPDLVEKEDVTRANSLRSASFSIADLAGKGIGGYLISFLGVPMLILMNALSFLYYYVSLLFAHIPQRPRILNQEQRNIWIDLKEGLKEFFGNIGLRTILVGFMLSNFFVTGIFSLSMAVFIQRGFSVEQYGILMAFLGVGALLGMLTVSFIKIPIRHYFKTIFIGFIIIGVCFIGLMFTKNLPLSCFLISLGMFGNSISNAILNTVFILGVEPEKRGKLSGLISAMSNGLTPVSSILYGFLGEFVSLSLLFGLGIALGVASTLIALLQSKVYDFISLNQQQVA